MFDCMCFLFLFVLSYVNVHNSNAIFENLDKMKRA